MAFSEEIREQIERYIKKDLGKKEHFIYIEDKRLRKRLCDELSIARYVYKILEGMKVSNEIQLGQIRLQILMYASIFEAVIHYLLFDVFKEEIVDEFKKNQLKKISIPALKKDKLKKELIHEMNGEKEIVPCYIEQVSSSEREIKFGEKCLVAKKIGLINEEINNVLGDVYRVRNAIHIHNELESEVNYEFELVKKSLNYLKKFDESILKKYLQKGFKSKYIKKGRKKYQVSYILLNNYIIIKKNKVNDDNIVCLEGEKILELYKEIKKNKHTEVTQILVEIFGKKFLNKKNLILEIVEDENIIQEIKNKVEEYYI